MQHATPPLVLDYEDHGSLKGTSTYACLQSGSGPPGEEREDLTLQPPLSVTN